MNTNSKTSYYEADTGIDVDTSKVQFQARDSISQSELDSLVHRHYNYPVASLYLNLSPDRLLRDRPVYLTVVDSLLHTAIESRQDYIAGLDHDSQRQLKQDLNQIRWYLENQFNADDARSIILFKSGDQLSRIYKLKVPGHDYLALDMDPYTLAAEEILQLQKPLFVLRIEEGGAQFWLYRLGQIDEVAGIYSNVRKIQESAAKDNKASRYHEDLMHRHFLAVEQTLDDLGQKHPGASLVLSGDERVLSDFKDHVLSDQWKGRLIGQLPYWQDVTPADWMDSIEQMLATAEQREEADFAEVLEQEQGRGQLVTQIDNLINDQKYSSARVMGIDPDLKKPGWACPVDQFISLSPGQCPLCQRKLVSIENAVDKLVEIAHAYNMSLKLFIEQPEKLRAYGGVAAIPQEAART